MNWGRAPTMDRTIGRFFAMWNNTVAAVSTQVELRNNTNVINSIPKHYFSKKVVGWVPIPTLSGEKPNNSKLYHI